MKKIILGTFSAIIFLPSVFFGQIPTPVPLADKEMRDSSSNRRRALELERVKRDAGKLNLSEGANKINFAEVKTDFENVQKLQTSIVRTYTTGKTIRYRDISRYALEINKKALRLRSNLFPPSGKKSETTEKKETKIPTGIEGLIVQLDNNIGSFAASPMFQNLRVVDPAVYEKTRLDLEQIIKLSSALNQLADQLAG